MHATLLQWKLLPNTLIHGKKKTQYNESNIVDKLKGMQLDN